MDELKSITKHGNRLQIQCSKLSAELNEIKLSLSIKVIIQNANTCSALIIPALYNQSDNNNKKQL